MKKQFIPIIILVAYCAILVKVMVFKDLPMIRLGQLMLNFGGTNTGHAPNFLPFKTIVPYLLGYKGLMIAGINLVGNIALLVPVGFLVPLVYRNMTWKKSLILAGAAGFVIEILQVILRVGIFDIDDVILNALGVMIGYWVVTLLVKWIRARNYKNIIIAGTLFIVAIAGALYIIYPKGQPVNPETGEISQNEDLCGGTGGTGRIVRVGNHMITIERNDGLIQSFALTDQTVIKNSEGLASETDLKSGDRVTLVVNDSETVSVVLACN